MNKSENNVEICKSGLKYIKDTSMFDLVTEVFKQMSSTVSLDMRP